MRLYYTLADCPHDMVEIECAKCGRHGRLRTSRLLVKHGPHIKLPDLLRVIAQCPKWGSMTDGCEASYANCRGTAVGVTLGAQEGAG